MPKIFALTVVAGILEVLTSGSASAATLALDPAQGRVVERCQAKSSPRQVWLFKQWHLPPSVDTHAAGASGTRPQAANQTAIYRQLDAWIASGNLSEIFAEGCEGELDAKSDLAINGWKIADLASLSAQPGYDQIVTSVPLKLEAKYGDKLRTLCGDRPALIRQNQLAFSDARGAVGFLSRLMDKKTSDSRAKDYLDSVIGLYKLPSTTTRAQAIARLKVELRASVRSVRELIEKRNAALVARVKSSSEPVVAVVYGGAHAQGIVKLLNQAKLGCSVVEPTGYTDDEARLLSQLEEGLRKL